MRGELKKKIIFPLCGQQKCRDGHDGALRHEADPVAGPVHDKLRTALLDGIDEDGVNSV